MTDRDRQARLAQLIALLARAVEQGPKPAPRPVVFRSQCVVVEAEPATSRITSVVQGMGFLHQGTRKLV